MGQPACRLDPHNQHSAGIEVPGTRRHRSGTIDRLHERQHVARQDDDVERAAEVERGQVGEHPRDVGPPPPRPLEHVGIGVHADDLDAAAGQLDADPPGAAAGVQDARRTEARDEVRLTVHRLASGRHALPPGVVVIEVDALSPLPPRRRRHGTRALIFFGTHMRHASRTSSRISSTSIAASRTTTHR